MFPPHPEPGVCFQHDRSHTPPLNAQVLARLSAKPTYATAQLGGAAPGPRVPDLDAAPDLDASMGRMWAAVELCLAWWLRFWARPEFEVSPGEPEPITSLYVAYVVYYHRIPEANRRYGLRNVILWLHVQQGRRGLWRVRLGMARNRRVGWGHSRADAAGIQTDMTVKADRVGGWRDPPESMEVCAGRLGFG